MTRRIDAITHTPGKYVKITINHGDGDVERITVAANPSQATVTARYEYCPEEAIMPTESPDTTYRDDRRDVHAAINDALTSLDIDDTVMQTIDRLRRVGHWMDDQNPVMPDDITGVDVHGDYKPLRSGQDMLLVDDEGTASRSQTPFVKVSDELPSIDEMRDDLNQKVERRVKRGMCGQQRSYYEDSDRYVEAVITEVESLQEAAQIVRRDRHGDDGEGDSEDAGGQAALTKF